MRRRWLWWIAVSTTLYAQEDASGLAWSGLGEAIGQAVRVSRFNPAVLGDHPTSCLVLAVVPTLFEVEGLSQIGAAVGVSWPDVGTAFAVDRVRAGSSARYGVRGDVGFTITDHLSLGVAAGLKAWTFPRYAPVLEWEGTVGVRSRMEEAVLGFIVGGRTQEGRPWSSEDAIVGFGCELSVDEDVVVAMEAVRMTELELRAGLHVRLAEGVGAVLSWADLRGVIGGGVDATTGRWGLFMGTRWHPLLGWTHAADVSYRWGSP